MYFCEICEHFKRPIWKNICERLLLYFHYDSRHHYHHHHFHYHCKMQLCRLRIILTIPLDCCMIPCLFQLNFVFFLLSYVIPSFSLFTPSKRTQISFTTARQILDVFFILIFVSVGICTSLFTFTCFYLFTLTYLYLCSMNTII